jgi:hypothetical protein
VKKTLTLFSALILSTSISLAVWVSGNITSNSTTPITLREGNTYAIAVNNDSTGGLVSVQYLQGVADYVSYEGMDAVATDFAFKFVALSAECQIVVASLSAGDIDYRIIVIED